MFKHTTAKKLLNDNGHGNNGIPMALSSVVMKFGGTSVQNTKMIGEVVGIIKRYRARRQTIVVVSAMSRVTDGLVNTANRVVAGTAKENEIKDFISELKERHRITIEEVVLKKYRPPVLIEIERLLDELEKVLTGVSYVGELTPRSLDFVMSFGERLSAPIISGALNSADIKSKWFTGFEAGIVTDSNFGKAAPILDQTEEKIKMVLGSIRDMVPVVTGFVAGDTKGRITTLGRGGSDYSAAIIGSVLGVDEIWIWTDVDGILTTDPRIVEDASIIKVISYAEAMELAYFGAKVLHPKTIEPAIEKSIPVRVLNTFKPEKEGTMIVKKQNEISDVVKAISVTKDVVLLTISGAGMIGVPGVAARVFGALARKNVNILMISQGSSEVNISIVIEKGDLKRAVRTIKREFEGTNIIRDIQHAKNIAVIAVIGAGMQGTRGVAARVFTSVAKAAVNVLMIAQGSSEVNISFIIHEKDAKKAVNALHDEFVKNPI